MTDRLFMPEDERQDEDKSAPEAGTREWFVSYDVTDRAIVLQRVGEDPHNVSGGEAMALRDDLLAAFVAQNEHRILRGEDA